MRIRFLRGSLRNTGDTPTGTETLSEALACLSALTSLDLSDNALGDSGACLLLPALGRLPDPLSMRVLRFNHSSFSAEGAKALADVLPSLTALQELELEDAMWGGSVVSIASSIQHLTALTCFNLNSNRFISIDSNLDQDQRSVINEQSVSVAKQLLSSISQLASLQRLEMGGCFVGDVRIPIETLSTSLAKLSSLTHLNLSSNDWTEQESVILMGTGLRPLKKLR